MSAIERQMRLLLSAIQNSIDEDPNVDHIGMPEIHQWLADILVMSEDD